VCFLFIIIRMLNVSVSCDNFREGVQRNRVTVRGSRYREGRSERNQRAQDFILACVTILPATRRYGIMKWKGCGRKRARPRSKPRTCWGGKQITGDDKTAGRDLNPGPTEYEGLTSQATVHLMSLCLRTATRQVGGNRRPCRCVRPSSSNWHA
jgi:hypothetical protein